jgi:hypothetical protein
MMRTHPRTIVATLLLASALALGALAPSSRANNPMTSFDLTLAPKPVVTAGSPALASARFANLGPSVLNQVEISFRIPSGSFEFASPDRPCTLSNPAMASGGGTRVSCEIGKVAVGESVEQFVAFTAPEADVAVVSEVRYKRGDGRAFSRSDSDATRVTSPENPDEAGTCATAAGTLSTEATAGPSNPQSTSVDFAESAVLPCTPISVGEQERTPENPGCPPGESCTTQVSFVTIPALPEPAVVTIIFGRELLAPGTKPKNFVLWETPDKYPAQPIRQVQACPLSPGEDSCIVEVSKFRKKGIQVVLGVMGSGEDPKFAG